MFLHTSGSTTYYTTASHVFPPPSHTPSSLCMEMPSFHSCTNFMRALAASHAYLTHHGYVVPVSKSLDTTAAITTLTPAIPQAWQDTHQYQPVPGSRSLEPLTKVLDALAEAVNKWEKLENSEVVGARQRGVL
ncbi:hypothetical protein Pmani_026323 [Petrolisthes manimaculis]|uniref:Uncharacterized protein n=1 Tax=Petrolisthes manimaculis TaxID=1843537 RepID=A0AAE1P3P2_9EUCA|nr:hypothetical protein Pmani_026323 [Petrolisthes manimaculis]